MRSKLFFFFGLCLSPFLNMSGGMYLIDWGSTILSKREISFFLLQFVSPHKRKKKNIVLLIFIYTTDVDNGISVNRFPHLTISLDTMWQTVVRSSIAIVGIPPIASSNGGSDKLHAILA